MKVRKLIYYLEGIQEDFYGNSILNFSDQDEDYYTINDIFLDDDGDVCLQSTDGHELSVNEILERLAEFDENCYVYFEHQCWDGDNLICDIEGGWYTDDDNDVVMDVCYHNEEDIW